MQTIFKNWSWFGFSYGLATIGLCNVIAYYGWPMTAISLSFIAGIGLLLAYIEWQIFILRREIKALMDDAARGAGESAE